MVTKTGTIRVGQFSESPVLAIARELKLDQKYDLEWETERVPSSPSQFESLRQGSIDIAITSPDNVMLYGTTSDNPLQTKLDLRVLRSIDRGLGLALYTSADIASPRDLAGTKIGVDVPNSGFAFLLFAMLSKLGVERAEYELEAIGATPKRLSAMTDGIVSGTVLNAETAVAAENQGLTKWATSKDVSDNYLGTVLVHVAGQESEEVARFVKLWQEATEAILSFSPEELRGLLAAKNPQLADSQYISLLQSEDYGLLLDPRVSVQQLEILAAIRAEFGAYRPSDKALADLLAM